MDFDEPKPAVKAITLPRVLDDLSIDALHDYIGDLEAEITRVRADIDAKQAAKSAADSVFKS